MQRGQGEGTREGSRGQFYTFFLAKLRLKKRQRQQAQLSLLWICYTEMTLDQRAQTRGTSRQSAEELSASLRLVQQTWKPWGNSKGCQGPQPLLGEEESPGSFSHESNISPGFNKSRQLRMRPTRRGRLEVQLMPGSEVSGKAGHVKQACWLFFLDRIAGQGERGSSADPGRAFGLKHLHDKALIGHTLDGFKPGRVQFAIGRHQRAGPILAESLPWDRSRSNTT